MRALGIDPRTLDRSSLKLNGTFNLPAERPTQHARIPVKVEYPKIINYLWGKAFDPKTKKIVRARFGPNDIREAIAATGAQLPRVRPERFLYEAAQQRAIKHILAKPLACGFSVAIVDKDGGVGQFQKADEPNSLGLPKGIVITSADLNEAIRVTDPSFDVKSRSKLLEFVEKEQFTSHLTGGEWKSISILKNLFNEPELDPLRAKVMLRDNSVQQIQIQIFDASNVPFDRIERALSDNGGTIALILMRLTNHHFAAAVVTKSGVKLAEVYRMIFSNSQRQIEKKAKGTNERFR
jgi:hypothetical protein